MQYCGAAAARDRRPRVNFNEIFLQRPQSSDRVYGRVYFRLQPACHGGSIRWPDGLHPTPAVKASGASWIDTALCAVLHGSARSALPKHRAEDLNGQTPRKDGRQSSNRDPQDCAPVTGGSTLNRLGAQARSETVPSPAEPIATGGRRWAFVDVFVESHKRPPRQIVVDPDATDAPLPGHQGACSMAVFCGRDPLLSRQRGATPGPVSRLPGSVHASAGGATRRLFHAPTEAGAPKS
jgi:hypothetical protein